MRYKIITSHEVKPWYVLQEIYARLVRDKLLKINPDMHYRVEIYDELHLPTLESKRLRKKMKSGFLNFSSNVPVACEMGGPGLLDVYEPRLENLFRTKRDLPVIPVSLHDKKIFSFYPHIQLETISDLNEIDTAVMDINIISRSPYFEPMGKLMDDFMLEKDIALIRQEAKPQNQGF